MVKAEAVEAEVLRLEEEAIQKLPFPHPWFVPLAPKVFAEIKQKNIRRCLLPLILQLDLSHNAI